MFESAKAKVVALAVPAAGALALVPGIALAEGESSAASPDVVSTITDMATNVSNQGIQAITGVLPAMAGLLAAGIVVTIGIKWVRKIKG